VGAYDSCGLHLKKVLQSKKIVLPVDVVVGGAQGENARSVPVSLKQKKLVKKGEYVQDAGPATLALFDEYIRQAKTIIWNGALGVFEVPAYAFGTLSLARLIATYSRRSAFGVVGGGETVQVLQKTGMAHFVDHVSTGGGAMLEFLAGESLPGIDALQQHDKK
jgi:phosphoglycerate kinase